MKIIDNNTDTIENLLESITSQLQEYCPEKKRNVSAAVLATEEIMLIYQGKIDDFKASAEVKKDTRKLAVYIDIPGKQYSLKEDLKDETIVIEGIQNKTDLVIDYSYNNGCNSIVLTVEKYSILKDNIAYALKYVGNNKKLLAKAEITQVVSMIVNLSIPALTARLIVKYTENSLVQVLATSAAILVARLIYSISMNSSNILYNKVFYRIRTNLETNLSHTIPSIKEECFDENGTGPFVNRITGDVTNISTGLNTIFDMITESVYYIGVLVATLLVDRRVFLCELAAVGILSLIEYIRGMRFDTDSRAVYQAEEKRAGLIVDIINGESDIKLLNGVDFFRDKMNKYALEAGSRNEYRVVRSRRTMMLSESVTAFCYFGVMVLLGYLLKTGSNTLPTTLVLFNYFTIIGTPFIQLVQRLVDFIRTFNLSCERVRNLQEGSEYPKEEFGNVHLEELHGKIEIENAVFAYNHDKIMEPDRNIINGLNITISPGETVAFVGKSGAGKSTLFKLISGQRSCSSGRILIDGVDIVDLDKASLRNNMMVVSQSPYFFNTTIKDNLLIAKPDATMDELKKVCDMACIREEIENTENGFDTVLGERGIRMSGGQKQRLAIARGLLKGSKIILFDEATSAIDNITQSRIKKTIAELGGNHTVLVIAHRLSTIVDADRIVLIDDGKILDQGKHAELMEKCEQYRNLYITEG